MSGGMNSLGSQSVAGNFSHTSSEPSALGRSFLRPEMAAQPEEVTVETHRRNCPWIYLTDPSKGHQEPSPDAMERC